MASVRWTMRISNERHGVFYEVTGGPQEMRELGSLAETIIQRAILDAGPQLIQENTLGMLIDFRVGLLLVGER